MLERIRQFFAPPEGQDEETRRLQVILYVVLATVLLVSVVLGITNLFGGLGAVIYLSVIVFVVSVVLLGLTLRGHLMVARIAIPLMAYAAATYFVVTSGIRDEAAFIYPVMIALAGLLLGKHGILAFGSLSLLTVTAVGYGELGGLIETDFSNIVSVSGLVTIDAFLAFISVLLYLNIDSLNASIDRARRGAVELVERTRELEASQRVTLAATERVTPDELLDLVVNLIRDQFDLYHAQVYLVDEGEQAAVLRQSTGYAGRQLLQRKHRIPLDATALVTQAVHTGEPVLVDDVTRSPSFMANPLLPETRSELVVPLRREGRVIGVLDVQDRTPGRFSPSTIALFQTIADQTVILFENNALLEEVTRRTEALGLFTDQLRTSADIARRLATILDPDELLEEVVELLQSRFGLYHAHIYLLDEDAHMLRMQIGSGEVGRVLKERRHTIPLDAEQSLVAQAARSKASVLVSDTEQEPAFMPNPLLPQTRSELAIPLVVSDKVLGVLDLQANQPNRFTEVDRDTFRSLAGQVATSLQTAELFTQVQKTEAHFRTLFESANDAIFLMRGDRFIDCNAKTLEIYRCTREQIIGDSPVRFSPEYQPDGQDSISKAGARIMA
ncbi:MAG: GAF domain-containing protein, partial [Anaerolineae bacterium]|nr:GAF domain-containing protein [Anaerolineae bacterium]